MDPILRGLSPQFEAPYGQIGQSSIPPEQLLRPLLLQLLNLLRSERQPVEQLEYILRYRWFVVLDLEVAACHTASFAKNRHRHSSQEWRGR